MRLIKFSGLILALACPEAFAQFLSSGVSGTNLSLSGAIGTPMNIAWDPVFNQYYGGGGGLTSYSGRVWNSSGGILQTLTPINSDLRSFFFNPGTGTLQEITHNARVTSTGAGGYLTVGLNSSGLLTGTYTNTGVLLSGLPTAQVVPSFDSVRNLFYAHDSGATVTRVNAVTGLAVGTITLDLALAGASTIPIYAIGYDPANDALISFTTTGGNRALAFSATTGAFLASIPLSGLVSPDMSYGLAFVNNQLFIYDSTGTTYHGFYISTAVPEPGTMALMALGLSILAIRRRQTRSRASITGHSG